MLREEHLPAPLLAAATLDLFNAVSLFWPISILIVDSIFYIGNTVTHANPTIQKLVEKYTGLLVGPDVAVGLTCSPLSTIGLGSNSW